MLKQPRNKHAMEIAIESFKPILKLSENFSSVTFRSDLCQQIIVVLKLHHNINHMYQASYPLSISFMHGAMITAN